MADMVFISISFLLILSCLGVCTSKNLVHSAVYLFFALFLIAGYYIMLYADFLAAVQVIVYVGGILVLIIFGVMLTNRLEKPSIDITSFNQLTAGLLCFFLFSIQCYAILNGNWINVDRNQKDRQQYSCHPLEALQLRRWAFPKQGEPPLCPQ